MFINLQTTLTFVSKVYINFFGVHSVCMRSNLVYTLINIRNKWKSFLKYYQAGTITCERRQCNRVRCTNPTFDECDCPICGQQCLYEGRTYSNREGFRNPADPCEECQCRVSRHSLCDESFSDIKPIALRKTKIAYNLAFLSAVGLKQLTQLQSYTQASSHAKIRLNHSNVLIYGTSSTNYLKKIHSCHLITF